jgi:hypothetical protein
MFAAAPVTLENRDRKDAPAIMMRQWVPGNV